jgi:hypothetical protein
LKKGRHCRWRLPVARFADGETPARKGIQWKSNRHPEPIVKPAQNRFTEMLVDANRIEAATFKCWVFCPVHAI